MKKDIAERLKVLLAVLTSIPLILVYQQIDQTTENKLLLLILNTIPSLIAVLVGIPVLYFLFKIIGLEELYNRRNSVKQQSKLEKEISLVRSYIEDRMSGLELVKNFEEEFYDCDWEGLINSSNSTIDIVVYYFDSWINRNRRSLVDFFRKSDTIINVVVSDPEIAENLNEISRLYSDSSKDLLKSKIDGTYVKLVSIANEAGADISRIKFYYYPHFLNYSFQVFDKSKIVISFFEMFRKDYLVSPTLVLNLDKSAKLKKFFLKEMNGLIDNSRRHSG
ncbi:hypothetical protein Xen7305DRAFT_00040500 [Xenococcus sp. PCC 7305]|uniref:hypothetical protein n=1 Tax=Xenococcus sp. PCC 7305 TaxID=102125 RepID=UPI0002AC2B83|nr:hypothetical protein [Xenococcus sp. PCC 7305]ELS04321.1 hypothetical protein Xen7305DRAFT_00040500 [Xenococcus sp. PCC 7305]